MRQSIKEEEVTLGIISNNKGHQIKDRNAIPLIDDLEIRNIFKDEDKKEGDSVTDFILAVVALLKRDINRLVVEAWEVLKLVKL